MDLKDFYLKNDLPGFEYVFFLASVIPEEFYEQHNDKIHVTSNGHVYARVEKGMYGLPQAGKVASNIMIPPLKAKQYIETSQISGLFKHISNSIKFALVIDDFLVQYTDLKDPQHLVTTLKEYYEMTVNTEATKYSAASPSPGIMPKAMSTYPCQAMWRRHSTASPTQLPQGPSMHPMHGKHPTTAPKSNAWELRTPPSHSTKRHQPLTRSHRNLPILHQSHRQHHATCPWHTGSGSNQRHHQNHGSPHPTT
jgi:hypothetical protein